jgi:uncharacterized protein
VKLELPPLSQGWHYYAPMEKRMRACIASQTAVAARSTPAKAQQPPQARPCTDQELVLGICRK